MTRAALVWGGAAAAILGLGGLAFGIVVATTATPAAHVQRYLDALARDDLVSAAQLAGLEPPTAMPHGDDGEPSIRRIIGSTDGSDGSVSVEAEYGVDDDSVIVRFRLEPAPPLLGLVPRWSFARPPVATPSIAADQHDRFTVNERAVATPAAGEPVEMAVFIPARITVRLDEPLLIAEPITVRVTAPDEIVLAVSPSARLEREVRRALQAVLEECATQTVLLPTGCPFGIEIDDRVVEPPIWQTTETLDLVIEPSEQPGRWRLRGEGAMRLIVPIQRLFDGVTVERDELVGFVLRGEVALEPEGPVLTIYPPGG